MKASFFERVGAYILDLIIISVISSVISFGIPDDESVLSNKMETLSENYLNGEVTINEYLDEYQSLLYESQKDSMLSSGVALVLTVGYFVVFQYMNKGKTFGKMALGIQVVDKDTEKPISVMKGLLRSLIPLSILSSFLELVFITLISEKSYMMGYLIIGAFESIFIFVSIIMVFANKEGRGLHDMMVNTMVIKEGKRA